MWATIDNAVSDLRTLISDNASDHFCDQKLVFGRINGTNTRFKTFERRRITDFTSDADEPSPVGVYINDERISGASISQDDTLTGSFILASAPSDGDEIRASYYWQWFLDSEIKQFLINSTQWLGLGVDATKIPDGLQPAALHYAAQEAYSKLALWFSTKISNQYMLDDAPDAKNQGVAKSYQDMAEFFHKKATDLRDNYYTRQGQSLAPLFGVSAGKVRDYVPRR